MYPASNIFWTFLVAQTVLHATANRQCPSCVDPPHIRALRQADVGGSNIQLCQRVGSTQGPTSCNWSYTSNYQENRIPQTIRHTSCDCSHCASSTNTINACNWIYYDQPVLIRENRSCGSNGFYAYQNSSVRVLVGCTCVEHRSEGAGILRPLMK